MRGEKSRPCGAMQASGVLLRCAGPPPTALYVSGRSAERVAVVLQPCLQRSLAPQRLPALRDSLRRRGAATDVDALLADWQRLQQLETRRAQLVRRRSDIAASGAQLKRQPGSSEATAQLRADGAEIKRQLRQLQQPLWDLQEQVLPRLAALPNTLHPGTPEEQVLEAAPARPSTDWVPAPLSTAGGDAVFGADVEPAPSASAGAYYLHGAAAGCELALLEFACDRLSAAGYQRVSCPDTVKSLVADGCGLPFADPQRVARLSAWHEAAGADSPLRLHLVGGASLPAVCALLAKSRQPSASLPLRLAAAGRLYTPPRQDGWPPPQSSVVRHLTACGSQEEADAAYDCSVALVSRLVAELGLDCRLRRVPACRLHRSERRRTELVVTSPDRQLSSVGHVSCHGDYISRRLQLAHGAPADADSRLLHLVEGCAVEVPAVLRALMRGDSRLRRWPACLQPFCTVPTVNTETDQTTASERSE